LRVIKNSRLASNKEEEEEKKNSRLESNKEEEEKKNSRLESNKEEEEEEEEVEGRTKAWCSSAYSRQCSTNSATVVTTFGLGLRVEGVGFRV